MNLHKKLLIEQVDKKLVPFLALEPCVVPSKGWIHTLRTALGMSLRQLGERLGMAAQSVRDLEGREEAGAITLKALREAGAALNMKLVYGFIPQKGSIEEMIEARALELAIEIVSRTSHTMMLEDQENGKERLQKAIKNKTEEIKDKMPRHLWD